MTYNIGIVGAGFAGKKRASVLVKFKNCPLVVTADIDKSAACDLAEEFGGRAEKDWKKVVRDPDVHAVIVATYNKFLAPISIAAIENRKHVLCEKPLGCTVEESRKIVELAKNKEVVIKTGFNLRHHPALSRAKGLYDERKIGRLIFLRCRYGHGGRPGYEEEWRGKRNLSGGGELLDQGIHVVDLFRWFAGDFEEVFGYTSSSFWKIETEDNAWAMLRKSGDIIATMHTSWTQWKNMFSFELFGSEGYLIIEGLGGSYGKEVLKYGVRRSEGGPPRERIIEFPGPDTSWEKEWLEFIRAVEGKTEPLGSGWDGFQANRMIHAVYEAARTGRKVKL
ncbi:MAG: Gfo/Idh/MocA family oxidoreductase [Candidatus Aminicenantes bacterium]|nr:Gfo/Idh/MocA family oxidoreductase [Candidatus Aminicenantes bacterium]